jgi:uncharacterized protein (DUF433 family)
VAVLLETRYEHIVLDEKGTAVIAGTRFKVIQLVLDHQAYGWSPEELKYQHPHLTLGQIYSALAYYWDHQTELDELIQQKLENVTQQAQTAQPTPFVQRISTTHLRTTQLQLTSEEQDILDSYENEAWESVMSDSLRTKYEGMAHTSR